MINFIKEIKNFYFDVYNTDLKSLSLEDLQNLDKHFKSFYTNTILFQKSNETEKLHNLLAFYVLGFYYHFCLKDKYVNHYIQFLDDIIICLETNPDILKSTVLDFLNNVELPVDRIISNTTFIDNPIKNIVFTSNLDNYNYLYYYGENITENHIKFDDTIIINTLDNDKYEKIHQHIIDVLDTANSIHITGRNGNQTNLTVALTNLEDPKTQTLFKNCCAAVNVPVGEVFTSPKLTGTNGILHVSEIYLHGWKFEDLILKIENGMISEYSCQNFPTQKENDEYINEHLLYDNKTLPMGEFAIGTNTHAYVMGNKYNINDKLDILIAEKTGPHFAFGDTCYSMDEDRKVYNPDGKEIIAKDNEISIQRKIDKSKAYFGVHTDVTIPYYELGDIIAITKNNNIPIIQNGKFVLPGTEELNIDGI